MKHKGLGAILLALPLSAAGFAIPVETVEASANSAAHKWSWEGADGAGAILTGDQCPIEVESEHLTFSLSEFPKMLAEGDIEEFQAYSGKFKAEYTFFNTDIHDYDLKLVFPLGMVPEYYPYDAAEFDRTKLGYAIEKDGENIDFTIRHTLNGMQRYGAYDLEQGIEQLYPEDRKLYRDDLPVTVYNYLVRVPRQRESSDLVNFAFSFDASAERTRVFCSDYCNYSVNNGKAKLVHTFDCAKEEALEFSVYVLGEDISAPESGVYRYARGVAIEEEAAVVTLVSTQKNLTFADLALAFRKEGSPVSETDWINAFADYIETNKNKNSCYANIKPVMFGSAWDFMEWLEYSLTIPAGQRVKNSVSAPIYPTIDESYENMSVYHYTYLLSPAQKWAKFGQLTVDIDTPYYISDASLAFETREGGYTLTRDRLPLCELTFTLSDGEPTVTPEPDRPPYQGSPDSNRGLIAGIIILCAVAVGAVGVGVTLAMLSKKKKRRREEEERRLQQTRAQEGTIDLPDSDNKSSE